MTDKLKDSEDQWLEALFEAAPIADAGFSRRVGRRLARRLWIRRLALPVFGSIGALIAARPIVELLSSAPKLAAAIPADVIPAPASLLPQAPLVGLAFVMLMVAMLATRLLED